MPTGPHCEGCPHRATGQTFVPADGLGTSGILAVGESPWKDEARAGHPFAGAAGAFLDRQLRRLGLDRRTLLLANSVWCLPLRLGWWDGKDSEAAAAMAHCRPHLDELIEKTKPRVIVTLGATALQRVLGVTGLEARQGYICPSAYDIPVIPTYHPSFLMQGKQKMSLCLLWAFRRAQEVAKAGWTQLPCSYHLDDFYAMQDYLGEWRPDQPIVTDIETPGSAKLTEEVLDEEAESFTIVRASLSWKAGTACSFPWTSPYKELAMSVLNSAELVIMWNQNFDRPRLEAQGVRFNAIHDAMLAWHFLQSDLPKSLGFVAPFFYDGPPWKHLSDAQPAFYSAVDADTTLRCYLGIRQQLMAQGRWERWLRHCVQTLKILDPMGQRGILIDPAAQNSLRLQLQAEYKVAYDRLQLEVPADIKPIKTYKKPRPAEEGAKAVIRPCPACTETLVV